MNKEILQTQIETLSLEKLISGKWWFFYYDLESDNSYATKYISNNTYLFFDIDETVNKLIVATDKDDLITQILFYFDEINIELCDLFQEE